MDNSEIRNRLTDVTSELARLIGELGADGISTEITRTNTGLRVTIALVANGVTHAATAGWQPPR